MLYMPGLKVVKFIVLVIGVCVMVNPVFAENNIKVSRLAGSWYPGSAAELGTMLDTFKAQAAVPVGDKDIGVLVSPHAGYVFSAPVAAYGFKAAGARKVSTVIILAPSHLFSFEGASVWADGAFETPLGRVFVDQDMAKRILSFDKRFVFRKDVFEGTADRPENSVETQIPLIQRTFPLAKIVPVIIGFPPQMDVLQSVADALADVVGERDDVLVVVSVDQSHFHADAEARVIDARGLQAVEAMDVEGLWQGHRSGSMEVDGFHVVAAAMLYAKKQGFNQAKLLKYATSADTTGDKSRVVGYASIVFYKGIFTNAAGTLNQLEKKRLLAIARSTLDGFVRDGKAPEFTEALSRLQAEEGAFVTLNKGGQLRGCIGNIIGRGPLYLTVRDMAVAAASQDPRFSPVTGDELKEIHIEISVLSTPQAVKSANDIVMGTHGVILTRGNFNRGVFLPQVAVETGWSKEKFLSELCSQKAGLPPDCWKEPGTRLEIFTADVFGEK